MKEKEIIKKLKKFLFKESKESRSLWKEELCDSEDIEKYGFNEYVGGKADAFEECLHCLNKLDLSTF